MTKPKKKLTPAQKAYKRLMRERYEWVFMNGKQKRVRRAPMIEGMPADEFIRRNADPMWLLQNEMYEELHAWERERDEVEGSESTGDATDRADDENVPF